MFIRAKTISGKKYGYLVESTWSKRGTRQKVRSYLGRIFLMPNLGEITAIRQPQTEGSLLDSLAVAFLEQNGFVLEKGLYVKTIDGVPFSVNLAKNRVRTGKKDVLLESHQGYFCEHTLEELRTFTAVRRSHSKETAQLFAQVIVACGIKVSNELFIWLYQHLFMQK